MRIEVSQKNPKHQNWSYTFDPLLSASIEGKPLGWPLPPKIKKLQLEPIMTNYGLISSSGHLKYAYMS
jgi:hypothetical protein